MKPTVRVDRGRALRGSATAIASLITATVLVWLLELGIGLENASSVYLLAVATVAIWWGTLAAMGTALGGFLAYNFLFVDPRFSFTVGRPQELLNLLLLLAIGILIGRLAGRERARERQAQRSDREARALFGVSRALATSAQSAEALHGVVERVALETGLARVWVGLGPVPAQERVVADTDADAPLPVPGAHVVLQRGRDEGAATWARIMPPGDARLRSAAAERPTRATPYRVEIRTGDEAIGSLWSMNTGPSHPELEETRLLAATADQVAQAVRRDRLAAQAVELEVASRSDELKSALLDSVSHDLRTPLATIRAAAGSLADPDVQLSDGERRGAARTIDAEADRLNRIVGNLLDMSRIQGGALYPDLEPMPIGEAVEPVLRRLAPTLAGRDMIVDLPDDLPPVLVDAVFIDQVLTNLLDNAARYAPAPAALRVSARAQAGGSRVRLEVEDGGPGVPDDALPHLFEKFSRIGHRGEGSRRGTGLGLAVVLGLVEAMGGTVWADRSALGGLCVSVLLPAGSSALVAETA